MIWGPFAVPDQGGTRNAHPLSFFYFHAVFCKKYCQIIGWCPLTGNPGSATDLCPIIQNLYEKCNRLKPIQQSHETDLVLNPVWQVRRVSLWVKNSHCIKTKQNISYNKPVLEGSTWSHGWCRSGNSPVKPRKIDLAFCAIKARLHLASTLTLISKFNIVSIATQTQTQRMDSDPICAFAFASLLMKCWTWTLTLT